MKKVDWSKPIQFQRTNESWVDAKVIKVRDDGTAIVCWNDGYSFRDFATTSAEVRNAPETVEKVVYLKHNGCRYFVDHEPGVALTIASARVTFTVGEFVEGEK